jgi:hypothetical protein
VLGDRRAVEHQQRDEPQAAQHGLGPAGREEREQRGQAERERRAQQRRQPHPAVDAVVGPLGGLHARQPPIEAVEQLVPVAREEQPQLEAHRP